MKNSPVPNQPVRAILKTASCLALVAGGVNALAAEGYKLRQTPIGAFGGEIAAAADSPGLFGTAVLTHIDIYQLTDNDGNDVGVPGRNVPLPTGTPTGGAVPNGRYTLTVPAGTIEFSQKQTQLNLVGGYLTESTYADGRIAFVVNVPFSALTLNALQPTGHRFAHRRRNAAGVGLAQRAAAWRDCCGGRCGERAGASRCGGKREPTHLAKHGNLRCW